MTATWRKTFALCCLCFLGGCYEDEAELRLNCDGSGTLKQKLVISERLIVAGSEGGGRTDIPPATKEKVLEKIGAALDISSVTQTELSDGGRMIEFEGTFDSVEQFFLSDFCRETMKLRLAPAGDGKAAIYCDMKTSTGGGPNLTQLYGIAKGLYVNRTVHLPVEIEKTNGRSSKADSTVSWIMDLRDRDALARTKAFVEGPDKGNGFALLNASALKFDLPLQAGAVQKKAAPAEQQKLRKESAAGLAAKVSWVSLKKKMRTDGIDTAEVSDLEIGIELNWTEGHCPVRCKKPVLVSLLDNQNNDLVSGKPPSVFQGQIFTREKNNKRKELTLRAKTPSENATKLEKLAGYVEVVTDVAKKTVVLENIGELAGNEPTGNPVLDKLDFEIEAIEGSALKIEIDGGHETITSLNLLRKDNSRLKKAGGRGWGNKYTYDFDEEIPDSATCELEVIVSENIARAPFSLEEIPLP